MVERKQPKTAIMAIIGGAAVATVSVCAWLIKRSRKPRAANDQPPRKEPRPGPDMSAPMTPAEREALRPVTLGAPPRDPETVEEL